MIRQKRLRQRLLRNAAWALGVIIVALSVGMAGYMWFGHMDVISAFANAAMILYALSLLFRQWIEFLSAEGLMFHYHPNRASVPEPS